MDPISDLFVRIQNASRAGNESVLIPHSRLKGEIVRVLKTAGFIADVEKKGKKVRKFLEIALLYKDDTPAFSGFQRLSLPSRRVYARSDELKQIHKGHGVLIVSTSRGVMTGTEAKKNLVGGEMIARVW